MHSMDLLALGESRGTVLVDLTNVRPLTVRQFQDKCVVVQGILSGINLKDDRSNHG